MKKIFRMVLLMKKFWKTLISCLLVVMTALSICACKPKPVFDIDDAKEALEDADYYVRVDDKLTAESCEYGEAIDERLTAYSEDGEDYIIMTLFETTGMAKKYYNYLVDEMDREVETIKSEIKMLEYYLKKFGDDMSSDEYDEIEDEIKEMKKELEEYKEEWCIGRRGKLVWVGNIDAIKDTK